MNKATKVLNEVKTLLGLEVKLAQMKLQDGVTVIEAESFEAGYSVGIVTPEGIVPAPVGEHILEDGRVLVVEQEGVIKEIKDAQTEETTNDNAPIVSETEESQVQMEEEAQPKKVVETISKELYFAEIESLMAENTKLKEELQKLTELKAQEVENAEKNEAAADPIVFNPETKLSKNTSSLFNKKGNINEFLNAKLNK
jgi:hypothetical protein